MELRPKQFSGGSDSRKAEEWLEDILTMLRSIQCDERYCLELIRPLLKDQARHWWRSVERSYPTNHYVGWEDFLVEFEKKFYPLAARRKMEKEFIHLVQGPMSVCEYEEKFHELSRWAPEFVNLEKKKIDRFVDGLKFELKCKVIPAHPRTFSEAVSEALLHE